MREVGLAWAKARSRLHALVTRLNARRLDLFPARQVILRQRDALYAFNFSSNQQSVAAAISLACSVWFIWSTAGYVYSSHKVAVKHAQILQTLAAYHDLADEVQTEHAQLVHITQNLEYYRSYLSAMVDQKHSGDSDSQKTARTDDAETARLDAAEKALRTELAGIESQINGVSTSNSILAQNAGQITTELDAKGKNISDKDRIDSAVARAALSHRVAELEKQVTEGKNHVAELELTVVAKQQAIEQAQASRKVAMDERTSLSDRVTAAEKRADDLAQSHEQALAKLAEQTRTTIAQVEKIMSSTGIDPKHILPMPADVKGARGGPFVAWKGQKSAVDLQHTPATEVLHLDMDRLNQLRQLLSIVPLASPLSEFMVTGPFGYRIDPFNNRPAFHEGLDMQAPFGTQVTAPAPGKVIFAGLKPAYGNLVEIDHGYNIHTRYAHLQKIQVHEGQLVAIHDDVGLLGQTGRAQAPHLHYEVLVDGEARNPLNFLKATAHVLKNEQ